MNDDTHNYLLIGLGGTGGSVLKNFRKSLYEEFRTTDIPEEKNIHIRYLYVDSSGTDINNSSNWRTNDEIGGDISLDEASRFPIMENNLPARLSDPQNNPVTHRYIGNKDYWTDIFSDLNVSTGAGGQIRRLGVALFEPRCTTFVDQVKHLVHKLENDSGKNGVRIHVFSGLAGGTGSGAFLHVLAQLRNAFRSSKIYPISTYLVLPESNSPRSKNGNNTNYYANGYAALQELNAYLISKGKDSEDKELGDPLFSPVDLTGNTDRFHNISNEDKSTLKDRIQGCYVISNINEKGRVLPIEDVPALISQFLYQRIFLIDQSSNSHRTIKDAISFENTKITDEANLKSSISVRSTRFQTFGIKRLVVPEEEILEHFSAQFAQQAATQMLYNNWSSDAGSIFLEEPVHSSFSSFVQQKENRQLLKLSTAQLQLEEGILDSEIGVRKPWKKTNEYWSSIAQKLKNSVWEFPHNSRGHDIRLTRLNDEFKKYYDEKFRGSGVEGFYKSKRDDVRKAGRHVEAITDAVESWLQLEWLEGNKSIAELEIFINDLISDLEKRLKEQVDVYENVGEIEEKMLEKQEANIEQWDQAGWFLRGSKRRKIFDSQASVLRQYFEAKTLRQANSFSTLLLKGVISELRDKLQPSLSEIRNGVDSGIRFFSKRATRTCDVNETTDVNDNVIKFYDPEKIRDFTKSLLEEKSDQEMWSGVIRRQFLGVVQENRLQNRGKEKLFASMDAYGIKNGELKNILEEKSRQHAENAHTQERGTTGRFIGVNIIQKLDEQFSDPAKLKRYVRDLMHSAQTFMQYEKNEYNGGSGPEGAIAILLPEYPENATFRDQVKDAFINNQPDGVQPNVIDSNYKTNEITIISLKYKIPLRHLKPVHELKEKFDYRLASAAEKERALQELYIENHKPSLPSLLRPLSGYFGDELLPYIALASSLDLFDKQKNDNTGEWHRQIEYKNRGFYYSDILVSLLEKSNSTGMKVTIKKMKAVLKTIDAKAFETLVSVVSAELENGNYELSKERKKVIASLDQQIVDLKENRGNNLTDEVYLKFLDAIESSKTIINAI